MNKEKHGVKKDLVDVFRSRKRFSRFVVYMLLLDHRLYAKYCLRTLGQRLTPKRSLSSLSPTISLHPPQTAPLGYPVSIFFSSMLEELHNPWPDLGTQSTPSSLLQDLAYCHQIHLEWDFCSFLSIFFTVEQKGQNWGQIVSTPPLVSQATWSTCLHQAL